MGRGKGRGTARKRRRSRTAGERVAAQGSLPELSRLSHVPAFSDLEPSERQREAYAEARARAERTAAGARDLALACVVRLDRGFPAVAFEGGLTRAEFAAQLTKGAYSRVAVGDWVCVRVPEGHEMGLIEEMLPRESDISRWRGGARGERQTLAANVDTVLVAQALGQGGLSLDRIARSAVIARDCGAEVGVVLTKADRVSPEELADELTRVRGLLGTACPVAATAFESAAVAGARGDADAGLGCVGGGNGGGAVVADGGAFGAWERVARDAGAAWGTGGVRSLVASGTVAVVLGESGAGKSTLLNTLIGQDALETGAVRAGDDAGRHTTVARRMVAVPGAGVIIDAPGLRSLPLVGHERGLAMVFGDVAEAARSCRFRDCTHTREPGCAVLLGRAKGAFSPERVDTYVRLAAEMRASRDALDPDVVL